MTAIVGALEAELSEKTIKVAELEGSLQLKETVSLQLKQQLSEKTVSVVELEERLQLKEAIATQLQQRLSEESMKVATLEGDLQLKVSVASRLQQKISEQTMRVIELEEHMHLKDTLVSQLQQKLALKESQLCDKDAEVALLKRSLPNVQSSPAQDLSSPSNSFWIVPREEVCLETTLLGSGAWGFVRKGVFCGQQVAVKCLHEALLSQYTIDQIQREINLMAQVRHPNLVLFIAAVVDKVGAPMIVTELLDISLRNALFKNLVTSGRIYILRDVAAALNYLHCHRHPIVHRDVSSANILLQLLGEGRCRAKLSDFGSANLVSHATTPVPGALVYTAPEALTEVRKAQSPSIDVYSFGVLMGEVVTGNFPNTAEFQSMLQQVQASSPKVHGLILQCANKSPFARPKMSDVLHALTEML